MIQPFTRLKVADNSGARLAMMIHIASHTKEKAAKVGDIITVAIKDAIPNGQVKKHEKQKAVIVRTHNPIRREDGSVLKFDDNACVIINPDLSPKGTRIFGPVPKELRDKGFTKIISLAKEVL